MNPDQNHGQAARRDTMIAPLIACLLSVCAIGAGLYFLHSGWAAILLYHSVLLCSLIIGKRAEKPGIILRGFHMGAVIGLVSLSLGMGWMFYEFIQHLDPHGSYVLKQFSRAGLTGMIPFLVYSSTINPVLEEFYWRQNFASPGGWMNDVFYALLHTPMFLYFGRLTPVQAILPVLGLVLAGALWRAVARKVDGLASSIIGHGSGDFAMLLAIVLIVK
ncbi:MAG: CPBP family intramembrane metalloprotease [Verrucomicrobiaceae bacterium]|nr:MAG: CPBP family intramembrane metalloprotease [Verrucomicrobiaceae bacterium]